MPPEKPSLKSRRNSVVSEEERTWMSFYRRVGHDAMLATEVLIQLEADPEMKRAHLALYLCCKESLRLQKARLARNKRIGQFVRWLCRGLFIRPLHALQRAARRGGELAVECLPDAQREPAARQVRSLTRDPEFARAASNFDPPATTDGAAASVQPSRGRAATKVA